jgi:predicted permease
VTPVALDEEVRDEIAFYLEMRAQELEEEGMDPEAARAAARRAFGDVESVVRRCRAIRGAGGRAEERGETMATIVRDLRLAFRGMLRAPAFAATVVLTLGLGIGAATSIFSVVDGALFRPLPFPEAERLVEVMGGVDDPTGFRPRGASYPEAVDWRTGNRTLSGLAAWSDRSLAVTDEAGGEAEMLGAEAVTASYFEVLGVAPAAGAAPGPSAHRSGGPLEVVISDRLWRDRLGGVPDVVGRTLSIAEQAWTVVGVAPPGFRGVTGSTDLWIPVEAFDDGSERGSRYLQAVGRLAEGMTVGAAGEDLASVAARLAAEYPETHGDRTARVTGLQAALLGETSTLLVVLLAAVGGLLLISCANVANLLLIRSGARSREVLMRRALGAGRRRVVQEALIESAAYGVGGMAAGLGVALTGTRVLASILPPDLLPPHAQVGLDLRAFLFAAGAAGGAALLAGVAPAVQALRMDPASGLRDGGAATGGRMRRPVLQPSLVVAQVALALILLVGTGLMARSLQARLAVDTGVDAARILSFRVSPAPQRVPSEELPGSFEALARRLEAIPGVTSVAMATDLPLRSGFSATFTWREGREADADRIRVYVHRVSPEFFRTLGVELESGRGFEDTDTAESEPVAVVGRGLARRYFGDEDPVGQRLRLGGSNWLRIVGVAGEVRYRDLTSDLAVGDDDPDLYLPILAFPARGVEFAIRTEGAPEAVAPMAREAVAELLPGTPVQRLASLEEGIRQETARSRFGSTMLGLFGFLASVLAAVGLYGVMSATVGLRSREIAIRMAVGADAGSVTRLVVRQGMLLVGLGLALGLAAAVPAARGLEAFLFGVGTVDPATYLAVSLLLAAVAVMATLLPARRATRVDPQRTLAS